MSHPESHLLGFSIDKNHSVIFRHACTKHQSPGFFFFCYSSFTIKRDFCSFYIGKVDCPDGKFIRRIAWFFRNNRAWKQEYKKAEKQLKVQILDDVDILDILHSKTFERQGISRDAIQSNLVKSISKSALLNNYGSLRYASLNDVPVSAVLFLYDDRSAYYLFGANDPEYRNLFGGTMLLVSMIEDVFKRGLKEVDFVGVNSPQRGDYKISYNADLRPYYVASLQG